MSTNGHGFDYDEVYWVRKAMRLYGGSFVQALAEALARADAVNIMKIKDTWPEYWSQYKEMGEKLKSEQGEKI